MRKRSYFGGAIVLPHPGDYENAKCNLPPDVRRFRIFRYVFAASATDRKVLKALSSQIATLVVTNAMVFMATRIASKVVTPSEFILSFTFYQLAVIFIAIIDPVVFLAFYSVFRRQVRQLLVPLIG